MGGMKTKLRVSQWIDTSRNDVEEFPILYGIQANKSDGRGWAHCYENGKALLFDTPEEAGEKIKQIRKQWGARNE